MKHLQLHSTLLRYVDEIARCGSIRKAALKLNVASSAVNRQLLSLEADLGTPIFERGPRRVRLTSAGEILIHHIRRTLQDAQRAKSEIEDLKGIRRGEVSVAIIEGAATELLTEVLKDFRTRYPSIRFLVRVLPSELVPEVVGRGDADLGLAFNVPPMRGIRRIASTVLSVGVVMRPDHPLAKAKRIRLIDCLQYPICLADRSISAGQLIDRALIESAATIEPFVVCNSAEILRAMVLEGLGITFKSSVGLKRDIREKRLVFRHLEKAPSQHLTLIEKSGRKLPVAANVLGEALRHAIISLKDPK
ncbi:MAG: putative transcriptional regulator, LysR family [Hyphomicrobiales bacterium]|nr:putative transcriptional regulator, LysR family [Hyphomicrobiales bacterium]